MAPPRPPRRAAPPALALLALLAAACGGEGGGAPWRWDLPPGFAPPVVPPGNPMSEAKVELGRRLFHDPRLSGNGTQSCASCHLQALAFTDGRATAVGATGQAGRRNSPSIANAGYAAALTWASSVLLSLESQALVPLFAEDPVELGLSGLDGVMIGRLEADPDYPPRFAAAFPEEPVAISVETVVKALAAFQRTVVSGDSPFDRFATGADPGALSAAARRGLDLFRSPRLACAECHAGPLFMDSARSLAAPDGRPAFHNTGLYDEDGAGAYPATDRGLLDLTGDPADMGRFRAPSLRNVALTAPYMHDGSAATLSDVLDHYAAGGRSALARGAPSPLRDPRVAGFTLTAEERADLLAFLASLTDEGLLADPRFGPP